MKVKLLLFSLLSLFLSFVTSAQLIQGTIKKGANDDQFEIWLRPDFSNSTQYLFQIGMPIAFPASASPQPTGVNVVLDPGFTAAFGSNYSVTVNPVAQGLGGTERYFNIVLVRGGAGASNPQTWTAGTEFKVLTGTFTYAAGTTTFSAKLADYQDGGSDGQGNFYSVSGNGDYYVTSNSIGNFYASPGNSIVGGTAAAGYAQLMAAVNSGTVSGTSPLCIGATATYTSDGDAGGTWSSTNTGVATVNASTGLVTAVSAGTTDITYTVSGVSSFKTLTVSPNVSAGTVTGTSPLCIGGTATYTSNGDAGGTWSSSNTSVATVDANTGLVTAVAAGTTNIIYTVNSGCGSPASAQQSLTVNANVSAGTVSGTSPLCIGGTATFSSNGTSGGTWSSSNPSVATVDANTGLVTAVAAGTTNITYTVNSGCGSPVSALAALTVNPNVNAGTVSGTSPLVIGATDTYTSNGDAGGTWSSSNPSVATVDANTGLVTAVAAGTTNIIYTINSGCGSPVSAQQSLTVTAPTNAGVVSGTSPLCIGATATYTSDGDAGGTWSSTNTSVATVDANTGLVTAVAAGTTDITYTVNGVSSFKTLTVSPNVSAGTVSGTSPLTVGGTATYTSDGTSGGTWSSSNTGVATVDANTGLVTAVAAGTTNIIYTVNSGCGSPVSAQQSLTVNAPTNAGVVSGTSPLCIGATATYTSDGDAGGTWSSTNTSVATVDANTGLVTAVAAGTTDITYTVNGVSAFKTLTVNPNVSAGTVSGTSPLTVGGTATFTSNGAAGGTWSSSNTSVATVDANSGLVTAVAAGTTSITYTVNSGCGSPVSASASLTVQAPPEEQLIQGTIKPGANAGEVEVWLKPSFNNSTEYLFQIGLPIAYPASAPTAPTSLNVTLDPAFEAAFGSNYSVTVNPVATATGGTEQYFNIVLIRGGAGASDPQTWTSGEEFRVLTATFVPAGSPGTQVKLADYQDGGSDGQGNFYTVSGNGNYYVTTNSVGNFYAAPDLSTVGGDAAAGFAQTIATIGACASPVVEAITGTTTVTAGSTTQLANATAGGVWSSDNEAVATVDANGLVTGVAAGTATISYAVTNECGTTTVTATVTVENCELPEVGAITGTTTVTVGGTTQLASTTGGGVWSSNNTGIATVDASGLVTGVAAGTATISYAVTNNCGTTTVTATVTVEAPPVGDQLIQGTIKPGAAPGQVEVWLKPDFNNNTEYLFQIGLPIAVPATGVAVEPTGLNVTLDPTFVAAFGNNYSVTVNPVATNTAGTERYFNIVLIRGGDGASEAQTWTAGEEFRVLTATFVPGGSPGTPVKLADYQDGGSDGQGNFYTVSGNGNYYVTANSVGNFYAAPGLSIVGGDASAGYAQTIASIGVCDLPVVEGITGNFEVCVGATTQLANATAGGVWSSDNEAVATVDANGLVTGVAAGTATISYAVTNSCGTTTVTASISVAALPVLTTQNLSGGGCEGGSINLNNGITSSVDGLTVAFFSDAGFSNPISNMVNSAGTYYVRVTNAAGCSATGSIEVTVSDSQNPVVTCPGNVNTTTSSCSKSIAIAKPTYNDNCSVVTLTWEMSGATTGNSPATGINFVGTKVFNVGETVITYTATDGAGNSATCSFVVKVRESKAPVVKCPSSITKNASGESCGADIAVANPAVSDNCGVAIVSWVMTGATTDNSPTTGINYVGTHHFNVGTTTVKYTVKDASGNTATCSFTVKVVDKQAPVIDCPNDIEVVTTGCSETITLPDPVYSDNCGISTVAWAMIGATNAISPLTGINTIGTRTFNVGVTYVTYAVKDVSGNIKLCTFKVTVVDNTNPVVNCPSNISQSVSGKCNKSVTVPNPTFSDNCKVSKLTWVMSGATKGSSYSSGINYVGTKTFNVGTTTVTYTAKDAFGNSATCSFTVTITNPKCSGNPGKPHGKDKDDLRLIVNPNPSSHFFTLRILSSSNEEVEVNVYDGHGRRVDRMRGSAHQTYKFGYMLKSGVYMVEVLQGDGRKVTRIVKL